MSVDPAAYRDPAELAAALETDPIARARAQCLAAGIDAADARRDRRRRRGPRSTPRWPPPTPRPGPTPSAAFTDVQTTGAGQWTDTQASHCRANAELRRSRRAGGRSAKWKPTPRVVVLGEDVGRGGIFGQYKGLQQRFGAERVIDTPISEAAIMGAGVGMALAGLRPVVEMRVVDFALCGMDELVNQAAKNRFMFGGQGRVPLVARMPGGIWDASAAQHSQSLEAWFAHLPGVVVVCPSTPQDNYSLLRAALQCGDPVVYIEHKTLWGVRGDGRRSRGRAAGPGGARAPGQRAHPGELGQAVAGLRRRVRHAGGAKASRST